MRQRFGYKSFRIWQVIPGSTVRVGIEDGKGKSMKRAWMSE